MGAFSDEDLIAWDGSTFSVFFDGSANSLGGAGEDIDAVHVVTPLADTITDFETGPSGDVLDLSDVLFDAGLTDLADIGNFLQILDVGADAKLTLDPTGSGIFSGDPFAILAGVDALEAINVLTNLGTEEVVVA